MRALEVISESIGESFSHTEVVDIHHNFVARETWFGRELLVHRKGAISVPVGAKALIPGSMGTASYVVEGLGNEAAFGSCSHGAGRVMSRKEARPKVTPKALARAMKRVVYPEHLARDLVEEAPAAYRDVSDVLEDQEDLVARVVRLEPIAVLKVDIGRGRLEPARLQLERVELHTPDSARALPACFLAGVRRRLETLDQPIFLG